MSDLRFLIDLQHQQEAQTGRSATQQHRLYMALRSAILQGALSAGAVLPGSRTLAGELGVARNSVLYAYEQLAAEGYVHATRQGTVVAAVAAAPATSKGASKVVSPGTSHQGARPSEVGPVAALSRRVRGLDRRRTPQDDLRPFMPGMPALDAFPLGLWQRMLERAARTCSRDELGYRHAMGEPELRQAVATYLRAARGVRCHADQVVITAGTQDSLNLCAQLLADVGDRVWIEHPGYGGAAMAFQQAGLERVPITVDADGLCPPEHYWHDRSPRLIYTTPSHQYPLGSVLSLTRRVALIERARQQGAWILEDDYDSEFRHDGPPLMAMQGLVDDAPVVYLGTFSKALFPALRLGYVVLPPALVPLAEPVLGALMRAGRVGEQRALAAFIDEGHFTTHLRRMRALYAERQAALRQALARHWVWPGGVLGGQCGMHLCLSVAGCVDTDLAQAAWERGLSPRPLSAYGTGGVAGFNGLVMGYAHVPGEQMGRHVQTLARAMASLPSGHRDGVRSV